MVGWANEGREMAEEGLSGSVLRYEKAEEQDSTCREGAREVQPSQARSVDSGDGRRSTTFWLSLRTRFPRPSVESSSSS